MKLLKGYSVPIVTEENKNWIVHQVETAEALREYDVVVNCYPTGTGKTRALLNAVRKNKISRAMIVAPINELINQYERVVKEFVKEFDMPHKVFAVTSAKLDETRYPTHSQALRSMLNEQNAIIITNPDIVHYVLMQQYGKRQMAGRLLVELLKFPQLVGFDEFHYYEPSQLFFSFVLMASAKYFKIPCKYVFMTATPTEEILKFFDNLGLKTVTISLKGQNSEKSLQAASPLHVEILKGRLDDHIEKLKEVLRKRSDEDILIISDSLSRLSRIALELRKMNVDFGMVTGPTEHQQRQINLQKRVLLATPTIDVGYEVNRPTKNRQAVDIIFFEARSAEDLIQRLGRVGRVLGKDVTDFPSEAYVVVPPHMYGKVLQALELSNNRLEFAEQVKTLVMSRRENVRREFQGPFGLALALYEDEFKLLFPREDFKELLEEYFTTLEKAFGLSRPAEREWREELDFYYLSLAVEEPDKGKARKPANEILCRNGRLREKISSIYQTESELMNALQAYRRFFQRFVISFRTAGEKVYVVDPQNLCGSQSFVYDKITILTRFEVKRLGKRQIPKDLRDEVDDAYEIINALERAIKPVWEIETQSEEKFFIPSRCRTNVLQDANFITISVEGVPVYLVEPTEEDRCFYLDLYPIKANVNGAKSKVLLGYDALKAQCYLAEKPWECDLFPQ